MALESQVVLVLGVCLGSVFLTNILAKKLKLPMIIAPIILGFLFNFALSDYNNFFNDFKQIIAVFANFGLIMILFFIGLRVDFRQMRNLSKNSSIIALNAGHVPFELGWFAAFMYTNDFVVSLFVGIALAITAEEVSISILDEMRMLKNRLGQLIIEAGIMGDVFEIAAIAILGIFLKSRSISASSSILNLFIELLLFAALVILMRYIIIDLLLGIPGKDARNYEYFGVAFIVLLIMSVSSELLNFSPIIGALFAGLLLKDKLVTDKLFVAQRHITEAIEVFNFGVFEPIVFIWIGLSIPISLLFSNLEFGIFLTIVALVGKLVGSIIGSYFSNGTLNEGILIGWGLNARGATELFAVLIARNQGIIPPDVFSAIVFMTLMTTIISPIMFKFLVINGFGKRLNKKSA